MACTRFLCIDDQQDKSSIEILLSLLSGQDSRLQFQRRTPVELGKQIEDIFTESKKFDSFGLLLDLRLDMEVGSGDSKVPYRGPTLAQELRTRMAEGNGTRSFPIVLWSIDSKFAKSFLKDDTSHDLFDAVYGKDLEITESPGTVATQMLSLVSGYVSIESIGKITQFVVPTLLHLNNEEIEGNNSIFLDYFQFIVENRAKHEIALRLLNDLIKPRGLLVDESVVAARLGIDITDSGEYWAKLKEKFEHTRYKGPFFEGWPRWWWFRVEDWWNAIPNKPGNLRRIGAAERVAFLNDSFAVQLQPAQPILQGYGDKFFTVCVATEKPLDPVDGLRVAMPSSKAWHDTVFVSIHAALERINMKAWRIDPLDVDRLNSLKS